MNNDLRNRCISLRNAGYSHKRIADKLSRDLNQPIGKDRVRSILNERTMTLSESGRCGSQAMKRMGLDRIGGMKTASGVRA